MSTLTCGRPSRRCRSLPDPPAVGPWHSRAVTRSDRIAEKKARLDDLRPLASGSLAVLDRWYDVELTYTSNAIEGSTLTRSETAVVVEKGITIGGKPLKDHLDILGHTDGLRFVRALAAGGDPVREGDIREIHRLVLARSDPAEAGSYSRHQRAILGSTVRLPSPAELPALMGDLASWLRHAAPSPEVAFEAHYRLVTIHPFSDGNGRTARLLMNLLLFRSGYPPVAIGPEERVAYLDALETRQSGGGEGPWHDLMAERLEAALDAYLEHLTRGLQQP